MSGTFSDSFSGTGLVYKLMLLLVAVCLAPMLVFGFSEASIHWAIARSVDIAIPFFLLAFVARPLNHYWRSQFSQWALRNRRYLGVSWGVAFLSHGALIILLALLHPEPFLSELLPVTVKSGSVVFAVTTVMLATSNNWSVRFLSPVLWSVLHTVGGYLLLWLYWARYWLPILISLGCGRLRGLRCCWRCFGCMRRGIGCFGGLGRWRWGRWSRASMPSSNL